MKISIKELRIGNLALLDGRIVGVCGFGRIIFDYGLISDHVDIYNIDDHEDDYVSIKSLKPIQLTEEWLLRFGFNILLTEKDSILYRKNSQDVNVHPIGGFTYGVRGVPLVKITYVHTLQNIFYAMTGQELEIKTDND
jgi:hypothetical protein